MSRAPSPPSPLYPPRGMSRPPTTVRHRRRSDGSEVRVKVTTSHTHGRHDDDVSVSIEEDSGSESPAAPPPAPADASTRPRGYKRLIVCCDGTWQDSNSALTEDGKQLVPPSNVTRISRAIRSVSSNGISQITYYQAGVGSSGGITNKVIGGGTGAGLGENVREAYAFLVNNYVPGDEIFLIGFSRGAFTARSIGGLIGHLGIMTKEGLDSFPVVFKDFSHRHEKGYKSPWPDIPFPNKPSIRDPMYIRTMERRHLTRLGIRIRCVAVFDTVGSLGIPRLSWLGRFGKRSIEDLNEYSFYDTTLDDCIDNAFQALALDERRTPFQPAVWEKRNNKATNLIQVWFPGSHANIGGGYDDQEVANISLAWMMAMLGPLLDLDFTYIDRVADENYDYYASKGRKPRPWSFGKIFDGVQGIFVASGSTTRTPGMYTRTDPRNGNATNKPLRNTNEYIHSSVRSRFVLRGPGLEDKGDYDPKALRDWKVRSEHAVEGLPTPWYWEDLSEKGIILPEAPMRSIERTLLEITGDDEVEGFVLDPPSPPPPPARRRRKRTPP